MIMELPFKFQLHDLRGFSGILGEEARPDDLAVDRPTAGLALLPGDQSFVTVWNVEGGHEAVEMDLSDEGLQTWFDRVLSDRPACVCGDLRFAQRLNGNSL